MPNAVFHSLTGRLKTEYTREGDYWYAQFQSLTGRLKTVREFFLRGGACICFNPSQVG